MPSVERQGTLWSLQYLRGIAALLVMYFHSVLQIRSFPDAAPVFVNTGSSGVDVFFVLSGFVMWTSTRRDGDHDPWRFYRRRIVRVVPLYWAVTLFAVMVALLVPSLVRSITIEPAHVIASLFFVPWANPAFPMPGHPNHITPVIVPGWTLNLEIFFYLVFGLVLSLRPVRRIAVLGIVFAALCIAHALMQPMPVPLAFYGSAFILEFLMGALAAVAVAELPAPPRWLGGALVMMGFGLLLASEAAGIGIPIGQGLYATMIVYGTVSFERCGGLPRSTGLIALGDASYSLYLVHGLVLSALRALWQRTGPMLDEAGPQILFMMIALTAGTIAGLVVHRSVEKRLLHLFGKRPPA